MNKQNLIAIISIAIVIAGAFIYRGFSIYRQPHSQDSSLEAPISLPYEPTVTAGVKHSVPLEQVLQGGPSKDGIPSIDNPEFDSVSEADTYLKDDGLGLVVQIGNEVRFYPYQILVWHEIVNDNFFGTPVLITYCPLCLSGIVFDPTVNENILEFGTSGKLWNSNLVMYDRKTDSYWSQILGEAIVGDLTGTKLERIPSLTMKWADFKINYPRAKVLSRVSGSLRDYTRDPYGDYYTSSTIYSGLTNSDARLFSKEVVWGARIGDKQKAYALKDIEATKLIDDSLNEVPIMVLYDTRINAVKAFIRKVDGKTVRFELDDETLRDKETGSVWNFDGEAVSGEYRGEKLEVLILENHFWFAWAAVHPNTEIYQAP